MEFTVYGNCQSGSIANTLNTVESFNKIYTYKMLKPVHTISEEEVYLAEKVFSSSDLLIHQIISDNYKIPELATSFLMKKRKNNCLNITFPSLYFNGYAPHLDVFNDVHSILNYLHDYIIMYGFIKGLNEQQIIDLMQNENFYSKDISRQLLNQSIKSLKMREADLDIKVSFFIEKNYQRIKLFPHFSHPIGLVYIYIVNQILELLSIGELLKPDLNIPYPQNVTAPIYRSTYKNLNLMFEEDFITYKTRYGFLQQDQVVHEFYKTYNTLRKEHMCEVINFKKPFIINLFKEYDI